MLAFLLQIDWKSLSFENIFGTQVLERVPAGLSLVYIVGIAVLVFFLIASFLGNFSRPKFAFELNLPKEVRKKLSSTATNRSLRLWQFVFFILAFAVYGYHVYWTYYADDYNEQFQSAIKRKDLRNRRTIASDLRGWIFDRSGKMGNVLALYKKDKDGLIKRTYPLKKEMAHLLGSDYGPLGLERTVHKRNKNPMPEAWEVLTKIKRPKDSARDIRLTIDRDLQIYIAEQLKGKKGAIVVMNPQTGELLAMYSNPTFELGELKRLERSLELEGDKRNNPLLNRAIQEYYVPGSTFKTFTMISAFRNNKQNSIFVAKPEGFLPRGSGRPIRDYGGSCSRCGPLEIAEAYQYSSNQYFAQLAIAVGKVGIKETALSSGILPVENPADATRQGKFLSKIWNVSNEKIANSIAPKQSTIVTGKKVTAYDVGLEGIGQGYAGQMTPFQVALIASIPANLRGNLMKPKIEFDQKPQVLNKVVSPRQAAQMRQIMGLVPSAGTARGAFARVNSAGIKTGGKTGSAEKKAPVYDKNGKIKTVTKKRRNKEGKLEEYQSVVTYLRTDSWYISIAPLESPQIAISVVVEGGGGGSKTAAPIAAKIVLKARDLGLLGSKYAPKVKTTPTKKKSKRRRR